MADVPSRVMPDPQGTVSEDVKPQKAEVSEDPKPQESKPAEHGSRQAETTPKGVHTPDDRQQAAFLEERKKRQEAEVRIAELELQIKSLKDHPSPRIEEENLSEEGVALNGKIKSLEAELAGMKEAQGLEQVITAIPALKDNVTEFNEFRKTYPGVPMEKVARLFLSEKGLTAGEAQRKGLERPSGGAKTSPGPAMTEEDVKRLRETQPRKYIQLLRSGKLDPDTIRS